VTVVAYIAAAKTARAAAQDAVTSAKQQYASFTSFRDHSVSLAQQLRELATQILHNTPAPEKCPLCHTHFAPGELLRHMQLVWTNMLKLVAKRYWPNFASAKRRSTKL